MVLARRNLKYEDVEIVDIGNGSQTQLAALLKEGKADAVVCWEPFNTMVLDQAQNSYVVIRGGGHLGYIMVATAHEPTIKTSPDLVRKFVAGLAAACRTRASTATKRSRSSRSGCRASIPRSAKRRFSTSATTRAYRGR